MFGLGLKVSRRLARQFPTLTGDLCSSRPIVSFTFDDAPASAATRGAPILEDEGARATFYLNGGALGGHSDIQPIVSADQVRELARRGHEIACHTFDHLELWHCDAKTIAADLAKNRAVLAALSGKAPANFAYPYGRAPIRSKLFLQRQFTTCRGTYHGINVGRIDLGLLKTVYLYRGVSDAEIRGWIDAAVRQRGWLIFVTHDVQAEPTEFGITPDRLKSYVRYAKQTGCVCSTVEEAVKSIPVATERSLLGSLLVGRSLAADPLGHVL